MNETTPPPLALSPVALPDAPRARTLRLVAVASAPVLLASATESAAPPLSMTEIWAFPLSGSGPSGAVARVSQLLPVPPRWDAAPLGNGTFSFVLELAGGALNALILTDGTEAHRTSLTAHRPFASFSGPRFVRGAAAASAPVSAIVDGKDAVVLTGAGAGAPVERALGECIDAVVTAGSPGPTLVCKRVAPGAARGDALPGTVRVQPLDPDYRPTGADVAPFGDRRVFEVDADRDGDGLVIVATTGAQLLVAHRPSPGAAFRVLLMGAGGADPQTFSSPCVTVVDHAMTVAVLSRARTPDAQALTATWPLDAPP